MASKTGRLTYINDKDYFAAIPVGVRYRPATIPVPETFRFMQPNCDYNPTTWFRNLSAHSSHHLASEPCVGLLSWSNESCIHPAGWLARPDWRGLEPALPLTPVPP